MCVCDNFRKKIFQLNPSWAIDHTYEAIIVELILMILILRFLKEILGMGEYNESKAQTNLKLLRESERNN